MLTKLLLVVAASLLTIPAAASFTAAEATAAVVDGVVIHRLQTGGMLAGTVRHDFEYIEVYNNTDSDVDVTDWCVFYKAVETPVGCLHAPELHVNIYLAARSSALFMNSALETHSITLDELFKADVTFDGTNKLAKSSGSLKLADASGAVIDALGWGEGLGEGVPAKGNLAEKTILQRLKLQEQETWLQDTNDNFSDFSVVTAPDTFHRGGLYEVVTPVDVCLNTPEFDTLIPIGFMRDDQGNCYEDLCDNLSGLQKVVPTGYSRQGFDCLLLDLRLTELLPNVTGSDTGKEFIEIHNSNDVAIDLSGYYVRLGAAGKQYMLPATAIINAKQYAAFSDTQLGLTLPNTSASVSLYAPDGTLLDETPAYDNPGENFAWAMIDGSWQYTDQLTPGAPNLPSATVVPAPASTGDNDELEPCGEGKSRNPETNRCKNIVDLASGLLPCGAGEARNPETNRCRKITTAASALTPCQPGQERNPDTNRCRQVAGATTSLVPCQEGYERNPDTNRCRKTTAADGVAGAAAFPVSGPSPLHPAILISLTLLAAGYGIYEYRFDLSNWYNKLKSLGKKSPS